MSPVTTMTMTMTSVLVLTLLSVLYVGVSQGVVTCVVVSRTRVSVVVSRMLVSRVVVLVLHPPLLASVRSRPGRALA